MKYILMTLITLILTSCIDYYRYGNVGTVSACKLVDATMGGNHYKYEITIHHPGRPDGYYYLYTNTNYKVGDTIRIQ